MMTWMSIKMLAVKLALGLILEVSDTTALTAQLLTESRSPELSIAVITAYQKAIAVYGDLIPQVVSRIW